MNLLEKYNIPSNAVFAVAGPVGVGKTTMTKGLANALNFKPSFEHVDDNPYLKNYYKNFLEWGFKLQIFFLGKRYIEQKEVFENGGGYVLDRSIYEDAGIFALKLFEQGDMTYDDYQTYTTLFDAMVKKTPYFPAPTALVYIEGELEDIVERIKIRARANGEEETDVEYWRDLYNRYHRWISEFTECPVVKVNINEYDLKNNPESIEVVISKIAEAIHSK